jgi:hypothetical protein
MATSPRVDSSSFLWWNSLHSQVSSFSKNAGKALVIIQIFWWWRFDIFYQVRKLNALDFHYIGRKCCFIVSSRLKFISWERSHNLNINFLSPQFFVLASRCLLFVCNAFFHSTPGQVFLPSSGSSSIYSSCFTCLDYSSNIASKDPVFWFLQRRGQSMIYKPKWVGNFVCVFFSE